MKKLYIICLFLSAALAFSGCTKIVDPDDPNPTTSNVNTPNYPICFVEEMTQGNTAFTYLTNSFDSYNRFTRTRTIVPFNPNSGPAYFYTYPGTLKVQEDWGTENASGWLSTTDRTKYELNTKGYATMAIHYHFVDSSELVPMVKDTTRFYYDDAGHLIHIARKFVDYDNLWNALPVFHTQDIQFSFVNDTIVSSRKLETTGAVSTDSIFTYTYYTDILDAGEYYPAYKDPIGISQLYIFKNCVSNSLLPIFGKRVAYLVKTISSMGTTTTFVHDIDNPSKNPRATTVTVGASSSQVLWTNHCKQ